MRSNNYKMIIFDLDGTLLTSDFKLLPGTIEAVNEIKALGLRVSVATGRSYVSAKPFLDQLDIIEPMVFSNGCVYDNPETGEREVLSGIPLETALIIAMLRPKYGISLKMHFADGRILKSDPTPWDDEGVHFEVGKVAENLTQELDEEPIKIVFYGDFSNFSKFEEELKDILGNKSKVRTFRSHENYVEMTNKDVSKGDAVKKLMGKLDILTQEVIAVGDQENDYEMIRDMGLGVQAGSSEKLKEVSQHQIPSPENRGIEALYNWLKEDREEPMAL
ncbi:MAG: HAD-IIB family hydrolase [Proteobacteria bacterium]|nr:HAD-IIB family hydrolase [Pseudomonadota bacterium]